MNAESWFKRNLPAHYPPQTEQNRTKQNKTKNKSNAHTSVTG